jgi:hypothetical protein
MESFARPEGSRPNAKNTLIIRNEICYGVALWEGEFGRRNLCRYQWLRGSRLEIQQCGHYEDSAGFANLTSGYSDGQGE